MYSVGYSISGHLIEKAPAAEVLLVATVVARIGALGLGLLMQVWVPAGWSLVTGVSSVRLEFECSFLAPF